MPNSPTQTPIFLKVLKIVLVVMIPLMFLGTMTWVVLKVSGLEPGETVASWANTVPVVGQFVNGDEESEKSSSESLKRLREDIKKKAQKISELQNELSNTHAEIEHLKAKVQSLEDEKAKLKETEMDANKKFQVIAETYEKMAPDQAAMILAQMTYEQAAQYLNVLDNETKAAILTNMSAEDAAELTPLLNVNQWSEEQTSE